LSFQGQKVVLAVADENELLPEARDVSTLCSPDRSGRTLLLPGSNKRANEWYEGCLEGTGGPAPPLEWDQYHNICCAPVMLYRQRDAHYSPAMGAIVTQEGRALATSVAEAKYITDDLSGLPGASVEEGRVLLTFPNPEEHLKKAIVTMPWGAIHNYGHFVLDCLPAVAVLAEVEQLAEYRFVFPQLKPWHLRHLELLGIDPVQSAADWCLADDIVHTNCMNHFLHWPNVNYRTLVFAQMRRLGPSFEPARRLYIARRDRYKRHLVSEENLQARLAEDGFEILYPEELSIDQQITRFRSASIVIGCSGAGLANTIYCRPGTLVIEIAPALFAGIWVRNICALMGLRWRPYFCQANRTRPLLVGGIERTEFGIDFDLNISDFSDFISSVQP
jgi:capsular polysaccharide biosynthesis protein